MTRIARHPVPRAALGLLVGLTLFTAPASASASPSAIVPRPARGEAAAEPTWSWPVGPPIGLVEPFRAPPTPYAAGHRGIDLAVVPGGPVRAPADGVVSFAGPVAGRPVLSIDHGDGVVSSIEPVTASVVAGVAVAEGEPIGVVGSGGHCDAACVHFGVRVHGEYVSPMLFLGGVPRAVLLPLAG
ncbi:murein hydrolase activator EnvC family protein [Agromyces sp. NPDC056523]|uniref:murein hydrolase activator EnvC family protein n=1 Tax=Agromyces sp. NPDC056523 TaxID=3345850 RepID=UPI00366A5AA0